MKVLFAIAAGGALGAVMRHYVVILGGKAHAFFPYGTLCVNVLGSFLIGFLMEMMAQKWQLPLETRAFLTTGFLGGFTTFSAFSFDVLKLAETGHAPAAAFYAALSVGLSLFAVFSGMWIVRGVFT